MSRVLFIIMLIPGWLFSQDLLKGRVVELQDSEEVGVFGANVIWRGTSVGTVTDEDGNFSILYDSSYSELIISYVGFKTDTIRVTSNEFVKHVLSPKSDLGEVVVKTRRKSSATSFLEAQNVINVSSAELLKAACCNLSESFETNPSIDVNFSDAVSGTRQIRMLGLTSPYILIATENIPSIRGAAQAYGLSFIPGTWVESIQIGKGAGSVANGFESITGQINAELQKPTLDHKFFVNAYGSLNGRLELNTHFNTKVSERWSTGIYVHGDSREFKFDNNNDDFLDTPLGRQINVMNRWQYTDATNGFVSFLNVRYLNDEKQTGQVDFDPDTDRFTTNFWGSEINTQRLDLSGKLGYVNPEIPYKTAGVQVAFSRHEQDSYFGLRTYDIEHTSWYANALYNSIIGDSRHKVKMGASFTFDAYRELLSNTSFNRKENSVGAFFEYNYDNLDKLNMTAGIRIDQHNRLGTFLTPRLHVRYTPWERSALRFSIGRGKRSANIFTENQKLFATSRAINIVNEGGSIYGLDPEIAWNYGVSFMKGFDLFGNGADVTLDFYRTDFQNQVVVDWEDPSTVSFYNLTGESYANNFQAELNYSPLERMDVRVAYKYYDVKTTYSTGKLERPLTPKQRFFSNVSYETFRKEKGQQWKFDATFNWLGEQRFSSTETNPEGFRLPEFSPTVATLNAQVTRVFSSAFEVYLGGENITNVRQPNPVLSAEDPFGSNFDTTFVYGPIFGSMYYAGLRYKLN